MDDREFALEHWRWEREMFTDIEQMRKEAQTNGTTEEELRKQESDYVNDWNHRKTEWMKSIDRWTNMGRL